MTTVPITLSHWPADTAEPVLETTCGGVLRAAAERAPDVVALVEGTAEPGAGRRWRYAELLAESERAARALLARFDPGERVAVWAPNIPEWVVLQFGAALAGVTLVTVNPAYGPQELAYVLGRSRAAGVFLVGEHRGTDAAASLEQVRPRLAELREAVLFADWPAFCRSGAPTERLPEVDPGAPAQIQYTSGTTGFPKGAVIHHRGFTNSARLTLGNWGIEPGDAIVNPMPLFHTAGSGAYVLGAVQTAATHVLPPGFDPALQLALLERHRGVLFGGVPTMLLALLAHPDLARRDLSALRLAWTGGAPVAPQLVRRVEAALGVPLVAVFAQTEASPVITQVRIDDDPEDRAETSGRPAPQVEVRVADPATGETPPTGAVGELCTRGYHVMTGYFEDPEATAAAIDADGWLHTGDLGTMDERGYCRVTGRLKDMIIRGGENIYPREIEDALIAHPAVADVAVVGAPDAHWGEQVAAFVRPANGATVSADELAAHCRARLSACKVPRRWEFVDAFPLTASGKVQKFILRQRLGGT